MSLSTVLMVKQKKLVERLRAAGATGTNTAQPVNDLRGLDQRALRLLQDRAVIRESPAGGYYLDEPSWSALRRLRFRLMATMIVLGLVASLAAYFLWGR